MSPFADAVRDWHDFFLALAEVSASLTGLLFVAITLRPRAVSEPGVFESRAFSALVGLLSVTLTSLLMLFPRPYTRWAVVAVGLMALVQIVYSIPRRRQATATRVGRNRRVAYDVVLTLIVVAGVLASGQWAAGVAFFLVAVAQISLIALAGSAAWLLVSPAREEAHLVADDERPSGSSPGPRTSR